MNAQVLHEPMEPMPSGVHATVNTKEENTLNFAETFLVHRGLTPGALVTFIFLQCQQQVKVFTYPVKYFNIHWMDFHEDACTLMTLVMP